MLGMSGPAAGPTFDPTTKSKLDRWVAAKREKDFGTADAIRSELRAMGIEPDTVRPPERDLQLFAAADPLLRAKLELQQQQQAVDPFIKAKLDRWVAAKREKDFGTADAIRAELQAVGIEPDQLRPPDRDAGLYATSSNLPGARFDVDTEAKLDRWVQAKRDKDWALADSIRSELRALGIEPDFVRPPDRDLQPNAQLDPATEAKLDRWVLAKREKDFGTADALRAELRAAGLEPDSLRPPDREVPSLSRNAAKVHDAYTEAQLDRWVQAKRDKDFASADAIRAELRAQGIEPDLVRPSDRDTLQQQSQLAAAAHFAALQSGGFPSASALNQPVSALLGVDQSALLGQAVDQSGLLGQVSQVPQLQASHSLISRVSTKLYDPETEAQLDRWVVAKREKDFTAADAIRADLRSRGIEPDSVRPSDKDLREKVTVRHAEVAVAPPTQTQWGSLAALNLSPGLQREVERQLDRWAEARRVKDFHGAESIAKLLRVKGIDPEVARPGAADDPAEHPAKRARGSG
uniref:Uncharacterized protein n=1 Tax=Alexandrium monilatum TaxID=311494 RepID=A0A7S4UV66_9DINO|mmetsp:Transcript_54923/g.163531  ORF Transcript_54923/g.163531 Transcript_54923/m.163531 type:complete len:520 (+) Transcript_54923:153-1712(+)